MERRTGERRPVLLDAVVSCTRFGMIRGQITNLGEGGLYISTDNRMVPLDCDVSVTFRPDCELCDGHITVRGRVSHQSQRGFGVVFEQLEPHCREILHHFVPGSAQDRRHAFAVLRAG